MLASMNSATAADASASGTTRFMTNWMVICPYSRINLDLLVTRSWESEAVACPEVGLAGLLVTRESARLGAGQTRDRIEVVPLPIHQSGI
jgi:hypothetical protein